MAWASNRGLFLPVRVMHALLGPWTPVLGWLASHRRRVWTVPMVGAILGFLVLYPLDGLIHGWSVSLRGSLGGDVRRELEMLQQFGGVTSLLLGGVIVWLTMPGSRWTVRWLAIAAVVTGLVVQGLKMLIGRPRPKFGDPETFLGPFGAYPVGPGEGVWHAWEVWGPISSDLWSMPSSHTSSAVVLAAWVAWVQPRLTWVAVVLAVIVACSRILFGAHWASDVVVGGMVGVVCCGLIFGRADDGTPRAGGGSAGSGV